PVAGHERERRTAVADEDEGLHDLRARGADRFGGRARGRRPFRELFDPRVDAGALEHLGDPRDRLRPALHDRTVTRPRPGPFFLRETTTSKGDDVNEHERRATTEALFRDVNER